MALRLLSPIARTWQGTGSIGLSYCRLTSKTVRHPLGSIGCTQNVQCNIQVVRHCIQPTTRERENWRYCMGIMGHVSFSLWDLCCRRFWCRLTHHQYLQPSVTAAPQAPRFGFGEKTFSAYLSIAWRDSMVAPSCLYFYSGLAALRTRKKLVLGICQQRDRCISFTIYNRTVPVER